MGDSQIQVLAAIARAQIRAMGMQAENQQRVALGQSIAHDEVDFLNIIDDEGIGSNAVIGALRG